MSKINMNQNITIKCASVYDIPLILQFIKELAEYEQLFHEVVATEEQLQDTLFGKHSYAEVFLAYLNEKPVGFALFFHNYSTFLAKPGIYLEDLFVRPEARGQGIGKMMLSYIAQLARDRNCGRLEWRVLNWNEPAIHFYNSLGAEAMNEWTIYRLSNEALADLGKDSIN
jgi:GNAT superfamily N-acetyltransferase